MSCTRAPHRGGGNISSSCTSSVVSIGYHASHRGDKISSSCTPSGGITSTGTSWTIQGHTTIITASCTPQGQTPQLIMHHKTMSIKRLSCTINLALLNSIKLSRACNIATSLTNHAPFKWHIIHHSGTPPALDAPLSCTSQLIIQAFKSTICTLLATNQGY